MLVCNTPIIIEKNDMPKKRKNHIPKEGKINSKLSRWKKWKNYTCSLLFNLFTFNSTTLYLNIRFQHHLTSGAKNTIFMIQRLQCSTHPFLNSQIWMGRYFFFYCEEMHALPQIEKKKFKMKLSFEAITWAPSKDDGLRTITDVAQWLLKTCRVHDSRTFREVDKGWEGQHAWLRR